jgi:hypothetical protein
MVFQCFGRKQDPNGCMRGGHTKICPADKPRGNP